MAAAIWPLWSSTIQTRTSGHYCRLAWVQDAVMQVWLWSTSPYDCSWRLPLIRSRMYSPAEYWSWICLWGQCFDLGSISTGTDEDEENDKIVVVFEDDDEDFLHLPVRGSCNKGGGLNPCFNPFLAGHATSDWPNQFEAPLQCHWNATDMKLL